MPETLTIEVDDDGTALAADGITRTRAAVGHADGGHSGHGLIGMRERTAVYGGRLEAAASVDGFRVRAVIPRAAA
ncbi:hypothetical protein [Agromyces bauzanensis]|uniref:Uncharacterized protein n=1 Tax=Agromyces bauzanensis TaxID=1308924 RepID=A0A917PQX6_9MICO|nr:hypothetical protein [Agromyces bauzanensis]GGJ88341.1 hypothetical protein GCM10011372_28640 [Agromyces bauzanensis]